VALRSTRSLLAGAAALLLTGAVLAGGATAAATGPQLTGSFSAALEVVKPAAYRSYHYAVSWAFTADCDAGPCDVTISTLANSCAAGNCPAPPAFLEFADAPLRYAGGVYSGTFTVKSGCTASGTYYPYAYEQRTTLTLKPTADQQVGVGATATNQVTKLTGSLQVVGVPDSTGRSLRCSGYNDTLAVQASAQS
jgi:hypothetical protein